MWSFWVRDLPGWISKEDVLEVYEVLKKNQYGQYLKDVLDGKYMDAEFCYKVTDFYHPGDEGGLAWNDPAIGIQWPQVVGEYQGSASADGYMLEDGTKLVLSEKDQKWDGIIKK